MRDNEDVRCEEEALHGSDCQCKLCAKQREIEEIRKMRAQMHMKSTYKVSFNSSHSKQKKKDRKQQKRSESLLAATPYSYLDLQSTYGNDFLAKKGEIVKFRPKDNLSSPRNNGPISTTYLQSYFSTFTPKPDQPMKCPQMPVSNNIEFSSQSIYQKSFKQQHRMKPSLPVIQKQCLSLPKSLGKNETTQRNSYIKYNPEKNSNPPIKPSSNIVPLESFAHNFDTTYRNFFVSQGYKTHRKYDVDQIGNVNWKFDRKNRKRAQRSQFIQS